MHLFYCDETNLQPDQGDFFVYGGIGIPVDKAPGLHETIDRVRRTIKMDCGEHLKFNPCPNRCNHNVWTTAKEYIIEQAEEYGCVLIVSITLHKIGHNTDKARLSLGTPFTFTVLKL